MPATQSLEYVPRSAREELDCAAAWERAGRILDLTPDFLRRLRTPELECVSHHETSNRIPVSFYMAKMSSACDGTLLRVEAEQQYSAAQAVLGAREMQLRAALAGFELGGAACGIGLVADHTNEHEWWELARECAPIVGKISGETALYPDDLTSAAFSRWMSESAASMGLRLRIPAVPPDAYCADLDHWRAEVIVALVESALTEVKQRLKAATVAVIGTNPVACACIQRLEQAGTRVVALADESGALFETKGLDVDCILPHLAKGGLLAEYDHAEHGLTTKALEFPADVILLCIPARPAANNTLSSKCSRIVVDLSREAATEGLEQAGGSLVIDARLVGGALLAAELGRRVGWPADSWKSRIAQIWQDVRQVSLHFQVPLAMATLVFALKTLAARRRSARP